MSDLVTNVTPKKEEASPREPWMEQFLVLLSQFGNVTAAANGVGINRLTAYRHRHTDPLFAQQWEAALELGLDGLEDAARQRAATMSDTLMIFLLKAGRPEKYRERIEQRSVAITAEQAQQMSEDELEAELKRRGLL